MRLTLLFLSFSASLLSGSTYSLDINKPHYQDRAISTDHGAVITGKNMRIQARHLTYINTKDEHTLSAEEDILLIRDGQFFVARRFVYDFNKECGTLYDGTTEYGVWFVGGDRIFLETDKTIYVQNGYATSSRNIDREWDVIASEMSVTPDRIVETKGLFLRLNETPLFYFPKYKAHLDKPKDPPFSYKIDWEKGQNPRISLRYRFFSNEILALFARLDYRKGRGFGGAVESDYDNSDTRTTFQTKSYYAHDSFYNDDDPTKSSSRYRFQGDFKTKSKNEKTKMSFTYDKYSDRHFPSDFPTDDFVVSTAKRTQLLIDHFEANSVTNLKFRPRVNTFNTFTQELPTVNVALKPTQLGSSGVITQNDISTSYLDYVSASAVDPLVNEYHAFRARARSQWYRPFTSSQYHVTPRIDLTGLYYNNNPRRESVWQGVATFGVLADCRNRYDTTSYRLITKPYIDYRYTLKPAADLNDHFIFMLDDGYNRLHVTKAGVESFTFLKKYPLFRPNIISNLYAYHFSSTSTLKKWLPKLGYDLTFNFPSQTLSIHTLYNFENQVFDVVNTRYLVTVNEDIAFSLEHRHRSRFAWRKANYDNFYLDVTRQIKELLLSPLSDGRNAFLGRVQFKLHPRAILRFDTHLGWGRGDEQGYFECKTDLLYKISSDLLLELSFMRTVRNIQFEWQLNLAQF